MNERNMREFGDRGFGGGGRDHDSGFGGRPRFVPVKEGEEFDVKIEGVAAKGDGVAKKEGFVIFVPGTQLNDEVRIKITKVARKVAFAEKIGPAEGPVSADAPKEESKSSDSEEEPQDADSQEEAEEKKEEKFDTSNDSEEF